MPDPRLATGVLTTITLCGYGRAARPWAFNQMGSSRRVLPKVDGLRFWRLLGTGWGRGFSLRPDFSRYGLLAVWDSHEAADRFFEESALMAAYRRHAHEIWTVRLRTTRAYGAWSGSNPFLPEQQQTGSGGPVAVITRATLRVSKVVAFWRAVPATTAALARAPGLIASIGIGEAPFIRAATFSIWRSTEDLEAYAYRTHAHQEVIRRRHDEGWYREELFARFHPTGSSGTWNGRDPLEGLR
jgi:heme-degrading monooxygenase HmoA